VNTVVFRDGRRYGHNTDYWGFSQALGLAMGKAPLGRVLLLGAGGAGGAVANALLDRGATHLAIHDSTPAAAERLAASLSGRVEPGRVSVVSDPAPEMALADGIVNATPVGMALHPGTPVPVGLLRPRHWVADIIYFPLETEFLAAARATGCRTMDGSGMAVFQAVRAFELFSGVKPDPDRMRATFDAFTPQPAGNPGS
jgi:shikimate dehydrogenase